MTVVFEYLNLPARARLPFVGFRCVWTPDMK
jgi:hypothetical protein